MLGEHLSPIRSHAYLYFIKWHNDYADILTFFFKLKCKVLNTNIKFYEKTYTLNAFVKYLLWLVRDIACI